MCGIVGILGRSPVAEQLVDSLFAAVGKEFGAEELNFANVAYAKAHPAEEQAHHVIASECDFGAEPPWKIALPPGAGRSDYGKALANVVAPLRIYIDHLRSRSFQDPQQFDLPSNSQVFGRIAVAAGLHGILYPSARQQGKQCLALFPQNWADSGSVVEVADTPPPGAGLCRIDGKTMVLT